MAEEKSNEKKDVWSLYTFDLPSHPYQMDIRVKVEVTPNHHAMWDGLRTLREFLLAIDDYDFVRRVCQIEDTDIEHKGIGTLYHLPKVPTYDYPGGEEYQAFLSHVEKLMGQHLIGRGKIPNIAYSFFRDEQYKHPYALLLYALTTIPLGKQARYTGQAWLEYARDLEYDCPGLAWVYDKFRNANLFYRHYGEEE